MARVVLRQPFAEVRHGCTDAGSLPIPSVAVSLSQPGRSTIAFRITIDALLPDGIAHLGTLRTTPPNSVHSPARAVCLASCPGAIAWLVRATPIAPGSDRAGGFLIVDACPDLGTLGVIPLNASLLLSGGPDAGEYRQDSATTFGVTNVPAGARVRGYSMLASSAGTATLTIGALSPITVPAGASFDDTPENLIGPLTFTFSGNVAARWVSWLEPE